MGTTLKQNLVVFAYDFPHRKSHDFILAIVGHGAFIPHVLAAPRKNITQIDRRKYLEDFGPPSSIQDTQALCDSLGIPFDRIEHENSEKILYRLEASNVSTGIIAGARILPEATIRLFRNGVVNFHPGKLPETSGLDSFFYTLNKDISPGVTTHFVDSRVDAGRQVHYAELQISETASPPQVIENLHQLQIVELHRFLDNLANGAISSIPVIRPAKNQPMPSSLKWEVLAQFENWRSRTLDRQAEAKWFSALRSDNIEVLESLHSKRPWLKRIRSVEGWSPLIVASFNQSINAVMLLLDWGADPNEPNRNGTTPLMYAKTKLVNRPDGDYAILRKLVEAGADISRADAYGRSILDYVGATGDKSLYNFISGLSAYSPSGVQAVDL